MAMRTNLPQGVLQLLDMPWAFSQTRLLESEAFKKEAAEWGFTITLDDLQEFYRLGVLVPFYQVEDAEDAALIANPPDDDWSELTRYSRKGRIRDARQVLDREQRPHCRPEDAPQNWWDGFLYSHWQLLAVRDAIRLRNNISIDPGWYEHSVKEADKWRDQQIALASLSLRFVPSIVGQITSQGSAKLATVDEARRQLTVEERLTAAGFEADALLPAAQLLLMRARNNDPMREWWDLLRLSDHRGWFSLRGAALEAIWQRIGAEVLLRAHDALAEAGQLEPLPRTPKNPRVHDALHDRIGQQPHADGLHSSLARLGLSPTPSVALIVEGDTEEIHVQSLIREYGLRPHDVRVFKQGTANDWPHEIARYVAPQLGRVRGGRQTVEAITAIVVAMDREQKWKDPARKRRELQDKIQKEIQAQGAILTQVELDVLVNTRNWGEQKYELANFTDDELEQALIAVALQCGDIAADQLDDDLQSKLRKALTHARTRGEDLDVVFRRMQWKTRKSELARQLIPNLLAKPYDTETGNDIAPVIELMNDIYALVQQLGYGVFVLDTPVDSPEKL